MTISIPLEKDFDLKKIMKYKPFFFFYGDRPERCADLGFGSVCLSFSQEGQELLVGTDRDVTEKEFIIIKELVGRCFGCSENFDEFYTLAEKDKVLSSLMDGIRGNRIVSAPTDFEAMVSIICSQNVSFAQYKSMIRKIFEAFGEPKLFPRPRDILDAPKTLLECGVGYRAEYLINVADYFDGKPAVISKDDTENMIALKGVGPYSLDIFRLFQHRDWSYFYVDSLIKKIINENYDTPVKTPAEIRSFANKNWKNYAGLAEVYLQKFLNDI